MPDPVTPFRSVAEYPPARTESRRAPAAAAWAGDSARASAVRIEAWKRRVARHDVAQDHALGLQTPDDRAGDPGDLRQLARRETEIAVFREGFEHTRPSRRHPVRRLSAQPQQRPRGGRVGQRRHPGCQPQHHGQWREGIFGGPDEELAHRRAQRRQVENPAHLAQLPGRKIALPRPPDAAEHPARAEWRLDQIAGIEAAVGRAVVEHAVEHVDHDHSDLSAGREVWRR